MIRALIFDCFGVFYIDPVFAYMRDPSTPSEKAEALHDLDEQAARGMITEDLFIDQAAELLTISHAAVKRRFFHGDDRNVRLLARVEALRTSYKVALLSNIGSGMMDDFFSPEECTRLFDVAILSGDVKLAKPDKAIFELTCSQLGVELSEAIMIDDMQSTCDIVRGYGMQSICYTDLEQFERELASLIQ